MAEYLEEAVNALAEHVECPICMETYTDPRQLPCHHTFCANCIDNLLKESTKRKKAVCPTCQETIPRGTGQDGTASQFPSSFLVASLLDSLNNMKSKINNIDDTEHLITSGSDDARVTERCEVHPKLDVDMYCLTCKIPTCAKCLLSSHRHHEDTDLDVIVAEYKQTLEVAKTCVSNRETHLHQVFDDLQQNETRMSEGLDKAASLVSGAVKRLCDQIKKHGAEQLEKIEDIRKTNTEKVQAALANIRQLRGKLEGLQSHLTTASSRSDLEMVRTFPEIEQLIAMQQEPESVTNVTWDSDFWKTALSKSTLEEMLGGVFLNSGDHTLGGRASLFTLSRGEGVSGIVVFENCPYITHHNAQYLFTYKAGGGLNHEITIPSLHIAQSMALISEDPLQLVIAEKSKSKLHFVTVSAEYTVQQHNVVELDYQPHSVSVSDEETIIVANNEQRKVNTHDQTGALLRSVQIPEDVSYIGHAVALTRGYAVLDSESGTINAISEEGQITQTYRSQTRGGIKHMIKDSNGMVIAADWRRNAILVLDENLRLAGHVADERGSIVSPYRLYLDESSKRLYVACTDKTIHAVSYTAAQVTRSHDIPIDTTYLNFQMSSPDV